MKPTVTVESKNFDDAVRLALINSKRTLGPAINTRMFFLLARMFMLVPPSDPQAARNRNREYLNTDRRVYKIANSRARNGGGKALIGAALDAEVLRIRRRATGGVGYLRAVIVRAIKRFGGYNQFGRRSKAGKWGKLNSASVQLANQYGVAQSNVAIFRRSKVRNESRRAADGWNPTALVSMSGESRDAGAVGAIYSAALRRAQSDERDEILRHIAGQLRDVADETMAPRGISVVSSR
jgi:hypothetical protein